MKDWSLKACGPVAVLFGIAGAGQQVANISQHIVGLGAATSLGFFFFLVGAIAALKTRSIIEKRYP